MHQPCYINPFRNAPELPWVRLHALKDYFGMVHLLREFPGIKVTFNLVPSLLEQIEGYMGGKRDPFQEVFRKSADSLTTEEKLFLLDNFFPDEKSRLMDDYPRYLFLFRKKKEMQGREKGGLKMFSVAEFRDLQIWYSLCHFDEYYKDGDESIESLILKGENFSEADKVILERKESELMGKIIPEYRSLQKTGQIEISTSPFYHPILPLLVDPQFGRLADPSLPEYDLRFDWRADAEFQIVQALDYMEKMFETRPEGIWPSEGCLSEEILMILQKLGIRWTASDERILHRSLGIPDIRDQESRPADPRLLYRPYTLKEGSVNIYFRDHYLSDLIGFRLGRLPAEQAAAQFMSYIKSIPLMEPETLVIPVILDGENAWEYYESNGRRFLRNLYGLLESDPEVETVTFSAITGMRAGTIDHIYPGSWIDGTFNIWIGDQDDRTAWNLLARTREFASRQKNHSPSDRYRKVKKFISIAQGSDWFWWYGREHYTPHLRIFDHLFRMNLQKVYEIYDEAIPEELRQPVCNSGIEAY